MESVSTVQASVSVWCADGTSFNFGHTTQRPSVTAEARTSRCRPACCRARALAGCISTGLRTMPTIPSIVLNLPGPARPNEWGLRLSSRHDGRQMRPEFGLGRSHQSPCGWTWPDGTTGTQLTAHSRIIRSSTRQQYKTQDLAHSPGTIRDKPDERNRRDRMIRLFKFQAFSTRPKPTPLTEGSVRSQAIKSLQQIKLGQDDIAPDHWGMDTAC